MSRRVFLDSFRPGLAAATREITGGRGTFRPSVELAERVDGTGGPRSHTFPGPSIAVLGPGDVLGVDRSVVLRQYPEQGSLDAVENDLVTLDLTDAALPWLLSLPDMGDQPWLALLVLRDDEGDLTAGSPLPTVTVPAGALPAPADLAAWTHVEVRVEPGDTIAGLLATEARSGSDRVVARLICPRRLDSDHGWIACLVPATLAGAQAAVDTGRPPARGGEPAWVPGRPATLPVYHSWTFRTGEPLSFEDLARRILSPSDDDLAGLRQERVVDVRVPWPQLRPPEGTPEHVTAPVRGALMLADAPEPESPETWSDAASRERFRVRLADLLDADTRETAAATTNGAAGDLAPPLYGGHHTGHRKVPDSGWMNELNLEVRSRVAASLGARYAQVEQEFLMERAWEQVGQVREANRLIAAAELAAEAGRISQEKHLQPLAGAALTELADPIRDSVEVEAGVSLATALRRSAVPDGTGSTAFRRLVRSGGAVARRTRRVAVSGAASSSPDPVLQQGLGGTYVVAAQPATVVAAGGVRTGPTVRVDAATIYGAAAMVDLLGVQAGLFSTRPDLSGMETPGDLLVEASQVMGGAMTSVETRSVAGPRLRGLRRQVLGIEVFEVPVPVPELTVPVDTVGAGIKAQLRPMLHQLGRVGGKVVAPAVTGRGESDPRPLRRIMAHPILGFPIAAELLSRWPEWAVPGVGSFPENRATLLRTNSPFVEAVLVGLNHEFNRELLWREYPTDQAGTPFARFWPGSTPPFDEIAHWADEDRLGGHDPSGRSGERVVLLLRADVLRRFPGTTVLASRARPDKTLPAIGGTWLDPSFLLPVDERTGLFGFELTESQVTNERWMFVIREPMRGTRFGFDLTEPPQGFERWADLTWDRVPRNGAFVAGRVPDEKRPQPTREPEPTWSGAARDLAAIALQRPFQVAFSPHRLLGKL